ncbi:MAG: PadR family transcriptional regulator [Bacteroidota bacterium]|nr:PadR family transcriptional regulator [Bacteroidota bacterium]MEC8638037.1 PadR family transcriptional regulator [Bacteroidota bacterium]
MQIENTKAQLRKGVLELCILSILAKERKYASEIISHLKDAKLIIVEGTLYPLLTRLRSAGFLAYEWEESKNGPPRKYYSITAQGKDFLSELSGSWNELKDAVEQLTNPKN